MTGIDEFEKNARGVNFRARNTIPPAPRRPVPRAATARRARDRPQRGTRPRRVHGYDGGVIRGARVSCRVEKSKNDRADTAKTSICRRNRQRVSEFFSPGAVAGQREGRWKKIERSRFFTRDV